MIRHYWWQGIGCSEKKYMEDCWFQGRIYGGIAEYDDAISEALFCISGQAQITTFCLAWARIFNVDLLVAV